MVKLFTFIAAITMVILGANKAFAEPPKLQDVYNIASLATSHCLEMQEKFANLPDLAHAYNTSYSMDDLISERDELQKREILKYLNARPDIPDFGFIAQQFSPRLTRVQRVKLNSVITLLLADRLLKASEHSNEIDKSCTPDMENILITTKGDFYNAELDLAIIRTGLEIPLKYKLAKQKNYVWYVDDLLIGQSSVKETFGTEFVTNALKNGVDKALEEFCSQSNYPNLRCDK